MSLNKLLQPKEIILFNQTPWLNLEKKSHFFSLPEKCGQIWSVFLSYRKMSILISESSFKMSISSSNFTL